MKGIRCFCVQLRRAVCSWRFLMSSLGVGLLMYSISYPMFTDGTGFWSSWSMAGAMASYVITMAILPLFPFCLSYAEEKNGNNLQMWVMRVGIRSYLVGKFLAAVLAGMLVYIMGMFLYMGIGGLYRLDFDGVVEEVYAGLADQSILLYYFVELLHMSFTPAVFCGLSVCISVYLPNRFGTIVLPIALYYLCERMMTVFPWQYRIGSVMEMVLRVGGPITTMLVKVGVVGVILVLAGILAVRKAERRLRVE